MKLVESDIKLEIVGPSEEEYLDKLKSLIENLELNDKITFSLPIFDLKDKINKIDSAKIFVLPSKREAMPQSLIEAMARGKVVIASDNLGAKDLIDDGKNGYLFKIGDERGLGNKIEIALNSGDKIGENAKKSVSQFSWDKIIKKIEKLI
jgi:GalNAc-alpha-(1->4)-GalNAc-alpha-(1->3)-diNAcBac-PP-undecaprenol alpha-1,4-N-acetyl-D-galactosaminyltransferase